MWIPKNMYCIRKNNLKKKMRMRAAEDADWMRDAFGCLFFFSLLFPYWLQTMIRGGIVMFEKLRQLTKLHLFGHLCERDYSIGRPLYI